ncbi:4-hydroxy-tetrahydrodipicolinate reductase [Asticcacaulis sp. EMRT-3]|uniref:4-hydroxy-tetrahydrodipicolinate reductase n=1 Tax=Asticcacaulis sp. EMRT-3 TaxID=3040349 RepID=UPI0024AF8AE5|nr:4-hydroxy-tetrahydrodipicolinate reductase [Asticcacaulis sp. EMRT-3]MDI7775962.1 4-hydroxy-tetrahydrodipicolinate reductase [Asticcacaulis sp. EMRT-3]
MSAIRFAINGSKGRMGQAVARVLDAGGHTVTARFDKGDEIDLTAADVVIDFSTPEASLSLLEACAAEALARPKPLVQVIGSTGFTSEQVDKLALFADQVVIIRSGNFSLGVNLLAGLARQAAARLGAEDWDIEIFEAHHRRKVDAPSGTALMLGEAAATGRGVDLDAVKVSARDGITGARESGTIGFSVVRAGGIVGEHAAIFASEDEIITLSHSARDRSLFARGAVQAALWGSRQKPGIYDMQDVLGF